MQGKIQKLRKCWRNKNLKIAVKAFYFYCKDYEKKNLKLQIIAKRGKNIEIAEKNYSKIFRKKVNMTKKLR